MDGPQPEPYKDETTRVKETDDFGNPKKCLTGSSSSAVFGVDLWSSATSCDLNLMFAI